MGYYQTPTLGCAVANLEGSHNWMLVLVKLYFTLIRCLSIPMCYSEGRLCSHTLGNHMEQCFIFYKNYINS